jgi:hypothetical protein
LSGGHTALRHWASVSMGVYLLVWACHSGVRHQKSPRFADSPPVFSPALGEVSIAAFVRSYTVIT